MKFVLQVDEGLIASFVEFDVAKDGTRDVRSYPLAFWADGDGLELAVGGWFQHVVWCFDFAVEDVEHELDAFEAEHVIAIGGDFDFELWWFLHAVDNGAVLVGGVFVEFDAEVET